MNILTSIERFLNHHFSFFFDNIEEFYYKNTLAIVQGILSQEHSSISSIAKDKLIGLSHSTLTRFINGHNEFWDDLRDRINASIFKDVRSKPFLLVVDDTQIPRRGKHIPFVTKSYDHCSGKFQNAQVVLTVGIIKDNIFYPIDMLFSNVKGGVENQQMTKNDQLIAWMKEHGKEIKGATLLGDSWFTHSYVVEAAVKWFEMNFIGRIKSSFKVKIGSSVMSVGEYQKQLDMAKAQEVEINGEKMRVHERISSFQAFRFFLKHVVCENESGERITLISTDMKLSGAEIVKNYLERWKIESFFKMAKQELGLKDCKLMSDEAQEHWMLLVILAYMIFKDHEMLLKEKSKNATKKDTFEMIHDALSHLRSKIKSVKRNFEFLHSRFKMPEAMPVFST